MSRICPVIYGHYKDYNYFVLSSIIKSNSKKYREFAKIHINYSQPVDDFIAFREAYAELQYKAHFTNLYEGLLAVDLSAWTGHEKEEYFDILMSFFYDYQSVINPIFIVNIQDNSIDMPPILNKINEYFKVVEIDNRMICKDKVVDYIKDNIKKYNIDCDMSDIKRLKIILASKISDIVFENIFNSILVNKVVDLNKINYLQRKEEVIEKGKYTMGLLGGR